MLKYQPEQAQVNHLLYTMGDKANHLLTSFRLTAEEEVSYATVTERFNNHFIAKKTKLYSRTLFNKREQKPDEPIDDFITDLHKISAKCEYGPLQEEFIRDRIIAGMRNKQLSQQLQNMESEPTLDQVTNRARLAETVASNQHLLHPKEGDTVNVHAVGHRYPRQPGNKQRIFNATKQSSPANNGHRRQHQHQHRDTRSPQENTSCGWCGASNRHPRSECKAANDTCNFCKTVGHWESLCMKKRFAQKQQRGRNAPQQNNRQQPCNRQETQRPKIHNVNEEVAPGSVDTLFLSSLETASTESTVQRTPPLMVSLMVNDRPVTFKVDTGADATVIGGAVFNELRTHLPELVENQQDLYGPDHNNLQIDGVLDNVILRLHNRSLRTRVYVIPGNTTPLLGREEAVSFGLVKLFNPQELAAISTTSKPEEEFKSVFEGIGKIPGEYSIKLSPNATPTAIYTPRHVAIPLRKPIEEQLRIMSESDIIEPVNHATEWCSAIVPVVKKVPGVNNADPKVDVRITVDYGNLNESVEREPFMIPTVDEFFAQVSDCEVFSKLDATKSYFQMVLSEQSRDLTTFLTHVGRFRFKRLPMGLRSSSEVFQKKIAEILSGIPGVVNMMDDCLVGGRSIQEHDERLRQVLQRFKDNGVTLNPDKCLFRVSQCTMLGHRISKQGILPVDDKVQPILGMPIPKDITALRSFLGSVNYLLRFLPSLAEVNRPLRELLHKDSIREWNDEHTQAFTTIKQMISSPPILAWYDPQRATRVTADASMYGAGAVLEQKSEAGWRPVQYMSASFTPTQQRYSIIEKEACAAMMACEKFQLFLIGLPRFTIRTDHKPLKEILETKPIAELTVQLQRFRMRLIPFWYTVETIPGKTNYLADMLSRAPLPTQHPDVDILNEEVDDHLTIAAVIATLPATSPFLDRLVKEQKQDISTTLLRDYIQRGWPTFRRTEEAAKPFFEHRASINLTGDLLTYQQRLIIPPSLQAEVLKRLHEGHLPLYKCLTRAKPAVWWPSIKKDITELIQQCAVCIEHSSNRPEPLMPYAIPKHPWDVIGIDIATHKGIDYLSIIDGYSKFPIFYKLDSLTAQTVLNKLKPLFQLFGAPNEVRTDRGRQFECAEFKHFAEEYNFRHIMSSPKNSQSNGLSESGVKIAKNILDKNPQDPGKALLEYRATPNDSGYSPAQLFLSRQIKGCVPSLTTHCEPFVPPVKKYRAFLQRRSDTAKTNFDRRHRAKELPELSVGERVWIPDLRLYGKISRVCDIPRSYAIDTEIGGRIVRNRKFLIRGPSTNEPSSSTSPDPGDVSQQAPSSPTSPGPVDTSTQAPSSSPFDPVTQPADARRRSTRVPQQKQPCSCCA